MITDRHSSGLVMVIRNYHWLNSASRVLILTCSAPLVQTGEQFFTVWPWPLTLTYTLKLAKVKVDPHAKNQCQGSNGSNRRRAPTDKRTDTHTHATKRTLPCYAIDKNGIIWSASIYREKSNSTIMLLKRH